MIQVKKYFINMELLLPVIFVGLFIYFSFATEYFFKISNIVLLFSQMVELGLLTLAMSASVVSGGMDLSIGALASLCTVLLAVLMGNVGLSMPVSILLVLGFALACGVFNGFIIGYFKVTAMLVTIGTGSLFMGMGMLITSGATLGISNKSFSVIGQYKIGGLIPLDFILFGIVVALVYILFSYSTWGRRIYMIGSNPEVARFAAINIKKNILLVYVFTATLAFLCGLILSSRISSGRADVADSLVLKAVAATVLGGVNIKGGSGKIMGVIMGVAIFTIISNGLSMLRVSSFLLQIIIGSVMLIALALRQISTSKTSSR